MSGIGEYIHYWQSSYNKYGISKNNENAPKDANRVFAAEKARILASIPKNKSNHIKLQNTLQELIYPKGKYDPNAYDSYRSQVEYLLGEMALKWTSVWNEVGATERSFSKGGVRIKNSSIINLKKTAESIMNGLVNSNNIKEKETRIKELENLIDTINKLQAEVKQLSVASSDYIKIGDAPEAARAKDLISQINHSLDTIATNNRLEAIGKGFEATIATLDDRFTQKVENYSYDFISKILTGAQSTELGRGTSIAPDYRETIDLGKGDRGEISFNGNFTTNNMKMDINLQYENESFRITAKNYSLKDSKNVHLITNSPFLTILQSNASDTFINHYLNVTSSHRGKSRIPHSEAAEAHQIAKMIIAAESLVGLSQKQGYADTLVINNRSARKVLVKPVSAFFSPFSLNWFNIKGYEMENKWYEYNVWAGPYQQSDYEWAKTRIGKLIGKLHNMKITASLRTNNLW